MGGTQRQEPAATIAEAGLSEAAGSPPVARWAQPLRTRWVGLCALLILSGAVLLVLSVAGWLPRDGLPGFIGAYLALYGSLIALQRNPPRWVGLAMQRRLHAMVVSSGVGFYGVMTLARFLQLELHDLLDLAVDFEFDDGMLRAWMRDWLVGFSVQSLKNSIEAFLWPARVLTRYGMPLAATIVAAAWALYALGARVFPEAHRALEAKDA